MSPNDDASRSSQSSRPEPHAKDALNALPRGYRLQEYSLEGVLGAGGFGITYLALDHNLDCNVAIMTAPSRPLVRVTWRM